MQKINLFAILLSLILFCSCQSAPKLEVKYSDSFKLIDSLTIKLDSITTDMPDYVDYKRDSILIYNKELNLVSLVDIISGRTHHIILSNFFKKNNLFSFIFWNDSGISLLGENKILIKADFNNNTLDTIYIRPIGDKDSIVELLGTGSKPIVIEDSILITSGSVFGKFINKGKVNTLSVGTNSQTKYFVSYPSDYFEKDLGGLYFNLVNHVQMGDSVIISFPGSDQIAIFQLKSKTVFYKRLKPEIMKKLLPNYTKPFFQTSKKAKHKNRDKYFLNNYYFKDIIFNEHKGHIYRILLSPLRGVTRERILFIYDRQFKYLGASRLPYNVITQNYFINKEGFHIQFLKNNKRDENHLYFYQFSDNFK